MARRWSIERRLLRWVAGSAILMSLFYGVAAIWLVGSSLHRELDELAVEEIEEFEADVRGRSLDDDALVRAMAEIAEDHPGYRFSWRVWNEGSDSHRLSAGSTPKVELPGTWTAAQTLEWEPARGVRWLVAEFDGDPPTTPDARTLQVGMLLDAGPRRASARLALALLLGALVLTAITTAGGGLWLSRHVGRTLKSAASAARALDDPRASQAIDGENAPIEVTAVAVAFSESLDALRRQHSTNLLLTAGMAHELRSPLQNMMGETSVALLRDRTPDEYREVLQSQLEEMHDLRRTVDNLITLTALREPGALARKERIQLGAEAELRLAKEAAAAEKRGIAFDLLRDGDLEIDGDREALLLMLRNVVDNAIRHAPDGGRVELHLDGDTEGIVARIDDDGPGVPPDLCDSIFREFEQSRGRDGERGSYGLGLALARAAAEAHGGTISVEPSPLGGARFEIRLPRTAG